MNMNHNPLSSPAGPENPEAPLCPNCGHTQVQTTWTERTFPYGAGPNPVALTAHVPVRTCQQCGFQFLDEEAEDALHEAVCRHPGVQTPAEIRALREKHGLSRAEFARVTRLEKATLAQWESGELIPSAANDRYLALLRHEENLRYLRDRENGPAPSPATAQDADHGERRETSARAGTR